MAFMGQDGWKSSLSAQQQIKVTELEKQKEILKKELDKRTMIHDLLQQTFDKEKRHVDEEKSNTTTIKKELLAIQEKLGGLEKRNDKLQHDLLAKETQNISLQGQLESKVRQLGTTSSHLKKVEKNLEEFEFQQDAMGPPQSHPSRQSFSVTPHKRPRNQSSTSSNGSVDTQDENLTKKLEEAQRIISRKDQELKDMEVKLFEKSSVSLSSNFEGITPIPFDDVPLPTSAKKIVTNLGFNQIANRSKQSSIFFGDEPKTERKPIPALKLVSTSKNSNINGTTAAATISTTTSMTNVNNSAFHEKEAAKANHAISDLKMRLADLQQEKAHKEKEFQNMKNSFNTCKLEGEELKKSLTVSQTENTKGATELTRVKNEFENSNKNLESLKEKLQVVQRDTECQKHNSASAKLALEKKLKDQEKELQQEINSATKETQRIEAKMTKEHETMQKQLKGAQAEVEKSKLNLLTAEKAIKAQNDDAHQDLITKLRSAEAKLDTNLSQITSMESEAHKLNKQIQSQLEDSETLSKENNRLKEVVENDAKLLQEQQEKAHQALTEETTKVGTAQEEIKIVQAKLSVTEEELTKSKSALSKVESMMAQRLQETQSQLENASSDLEHAIMDKCTFEEELSEMKSARGDTDYIIATLKHELEEKQDKFVAIKALNDAAHQDLITKLQSAEAKLDTNLSQITSMESEAHKLNEQIQSQLEASETLSKENNRIKEVVENDAKLIHEQEKAHQALTEEITKAGTAQEEIKIVQAKLSVSEEELTKNKSTLSEVESMMTHQLQETQSQLENASSDLEHAIMDKCTLEEELREMKSARGDTDYTIATLKHELEEKQDKFVANNAENDAAHQDLITKLQSAEAKLDTNLSQITSMESEAHTLNEQIQSQLEASETLSRENNRLKEVVENDAKLLQEQQEKAHQALTEETTKAGTAQEEIKIVEAKLSVSEEELTKSKSALSEVESMMAHQLQETQSQLENASSDLEHAIMDKCTLEEELSEMKSARGDTDYTIATLKHELEEKQDIFVANKAQNDAANQDLITKLQSAEAKLDTNLSHITSMESEAHKLNEQVSFLKQTMHDTVANNEAILWEKNGALQAQIELKDSLKMNLDVMAEEYEKCKETLSQSMTEEVAQLESQLMFADEQAKVADNQLQEAKDLKSQLEEELVNLKDLHKEQICQLQQEIGVLQREKQDNKRFKKQMDQNKSTIEKLELNCQRFEATVDEYTVQILLLQSKLYSHEMTYDGLCESLNEERDRTSDLNKKNECLKTELAQVNTQLNAMKSASCSAKDEIGMKDLELTQAEELIKAKEESIANLESVVSALQEEKVDLEAKLESSLSKADELLASNESKDGEIGCLLDNFNELQQENAINAQCKTHVQGQLEDLKAEVTQLIDEVAETKAMNAQLSNNFDHFEEVNSNLEQQCSDLEHNLTSTQTQLQESNGKCSELEEKLDSLYDEKLKFNEELTSSYDNLESQKKDMVLIKKENDEMAFKLKSVTISYESKVEDLYRSLKANEEDVISKSAELMTMSVRYEEAEEQVAAFLGRLGERDHTIRDVEAQNEELVKQLNQFNEKLAASNGRVEELESSIMSAQASLADAEHQVAELSGDLEAAILAKMDAEEKVELLNEEATINKANLVSRSSLEDHIACIASLEATIVDANNVTEQLKTEVADKESTMKSLHEKLIALEEEKSNEKSDMAELTVKIQDFEQQLADKEFVTAKCSDLENQASQLKNDLTAHVKIQDELTEQLKHNQDLLTTSNRDLEVVKNQSDKYINEFEALRCELITSQEGLTRLETQNGQLLADKECMSSEISSLMERMNDAIKLGEDCSLDLQQCRGALKTSNEEIVEFKQKSEATEETCDKLRSEVIQLNQTISDLQELLEKKEGEFAQSLDELERGLAEKTKDCVTTRAEIQKFIATCEKNKIELDNSQAKRDECKKSNQVLEGQVAQLQTTVVKLEKDIISLKADKDSKMSKIKLLLGNQKKFESQMEQMSNQYEDLAKEKKAMVQQVAHRDALEAEVGKHQKRINELESEVNEPIGQMPWDIDPELQDMTPMELRSILAKELTPKEKAKLNAMCVDELVKEMKSKTSNETSLIWEISTLKKELQKNKIKLSHLEDKKSVARGALLPTDEDKVSPPAPKESSTATTTRKSKRRSVSSTTSTVLVQQDPNSSTRFTRSRSKTNIESDSNDEVFVTSATKKARQETSAVKTQENHPSVVVGGRPKRGRSSAMRLDVMPDNPFTTKKSTESSMTTKSTKRPLETITNKTSKTSTKDD